MTRSRFTGRVFLLEAMNSLATGFYFNYLFFFLASNHGFGAFKNLLFCAANGLLYIPCALYGGKAGQRYGYLNALCFGIVVMMAGLVAGWAWHSVTGTVVTMLLWTFGMCFTWPNLEALTCDHQPAKKLPPLIGAYNVVWAGGSAIAYFLGGAIAEKLGWNSIFWLPALIHLAQLGVALPMRPEWDRICREFKGSAQAHVEEGHPDGPLFLKLAWLANPLAYVAINATTPLIPELARKLLLSPKFAGFFCSIWFFSRMFTFVLLAFWPGWHYRLNYLVASYLGMIACFGGILLFNHLGLVIAFQVGFGLCIGLIYYSSLYYSMHVGDTKGEHGGVHEAAIGAGIFGGPAIGAASAWFFPQQPSSSVFGVLIALVIGFGALWWLSRSRPARA